MIPAPRHPAGVANLPNFDLDSTNNLAAWFLADGIRDFHAAARYVQRLPYGRNADRSDYGLVLAERRGTCSTKHALLAALACEHGRAVDLRLGIYEMDEGNTPGVGRVLRRHGLDAVPEAHCYLACRGVRIDLTRDGAVEPIENFLHEEVIAPAAIGAHKVDTHGRFMREWSLRRGLDPEQTWKIREECILALTEPGDSEDER